jgi:prepilin-type N-terminal cleavage/methylation domain-containing protein
MQNSGFTLLETMVALTVILAAVVGPVSLITRGLLSFSISKNKVIAANLAQEGIELVRLVRENNIACDVLNGPAVWQWNRDPEGGTIRRLKAGVDIGSFASVACGGATLRIPKLSASCSGPLSFGDDGTYGYRSGPATSFRRCVDIRVPPDGRDADIPAGDQMDVISTVTWQERGGERSMVLRERLYNWR